MQVESIEERGGQLPASKKMANEVLKVLKVMMQFYSLHGPNFYKLFFYGEVGYGWEVLRTTDA